MEVQEVAQVCLDGHVIDSSSNYHHQLRKSFCPKCGKPTITECQHCNGQIPGDYYIDDMMVEIRMVSIPFKLPLFCHRCGKAYPWTETKRQAAMDLTEELEGLTSEEKEILNNSIDDMMTDNPRTELGATKFEKFMSKAKGMAVKPLRSLIVDIASETAVKLIKGP